MGRRARRGHRNPPSMKRPRGPIVLDPRAKQTFCEGQRIAKTGCTRALEGNQILVATLPDWTRVPVCARCLATYLVLTGQAPTEGAIRYRVYGWVPRDRMTPDEATFQAATLAGIWVPLDVRWGEKPGAAIQRLKRDRADLARYTRFEARPLVERDPHTEVA